MRIRCSPYGVGRLFITERRMKLSPKAHSDNYITAAQSA